MYPPSVIHTSQLSPRTQFTGDMTATSPGAAIYQVMRFHISEIILTRQHLPKGEVREIQGLFIFQVLRGADWFSTHDADTVMKILAAPAPAPGQPDSELTPVQRVAKTSVVHGVGRARRTTKLARAFAEQRHAVLCVPSRSGPAARWQLCAKRCGVRATSLLNVAARPSLSTGSGAPCTPCTSSLPNHPRRAI